MTRDELNIQIPEIPIQDDPKRPRRFVQHPIYDGDSIVGYTAEKFNPHVLPKPEEVSDHQNDILEDPNVYASTIIGNENTNLPLTAAVDSMKAVDSVKNSLKK